MTAEVVATVAGVLATVAGLLAEAMRRKWVAADAAKKEMEERYAKLLARRNDAWAAGDAGGVFDTSKAE